MFTATQITALRNEYATVNTIDPCQPSYKKLIAMLDKMDDKMLSQVRAANIKFVSLLAGNRCIRRGIAS